MTERHRYVVKRKHAIDDRLQPIYSDRTVHRNELIATSGEDDADRRDGAIQQVNINR
jgi:hypothetical protein